ARSRRRYGGYIVHLGIVLVFIGFAGGSFERIETVSMLPGQTAEIAPYSVRYISLSVTQDAQKQMVTAEVEVLRNGRTLAHMYPARWYFAGREDEPTTEVALRRSLAEDLYMVLAGYNAGEQRADMQLRINTLINWMWIGVGIMVVGSHIAYLPERAMALSTSRVPRGSVTTALVFLLSSSAGIAHVHGQHVETANTAFLAPQTELEQELRAYLVCTCGGCGRQRVGECTCPTAAAMRERLAELVAAGHTRDAIVEIFIRDRKSVGE